MVYFVTYSKIPDGDAPAVRSCNIARIFKACGMDVIVIGMGKGDYLQSEIHDGLSIVSLRLKGGGVLTRLKNYFGYKKRLKTLLDQANNADVIILNALPINALLYIKRMTKQKKVRLFIDCCEWFSPEQFKTGKFSLPYLFNSYLIQKYIDSSMGIIAISKYLFAYFTQKKYKVARIPAILDVESAACNKSAKSDKLVLMYAGSAGRKDYLDIILDGLSLLDSQDLAKIELRIFGVNLDQIRESIGSHMCDMVGHIIKCYGPVPRKDVLKNLEDADFTVLMRSATQRYAKAGFPTKVVESLASATPVICNLTSDLGDYIKEDYNGIIVNGETAKDFSLAVKKAVKLSVQEKERMSKNARLVAEDSFNYKLYRNAINELLDKTRG